jgi:hypothetical protein
VFYIYRASCFVLHHVEHTLSSRVVPVNEEITEVESIFEEEPTSVEVGFNICGTDLVKGPYLVLVIE